MASRAHAVPGNVLGGMFVDSTCILCGTCFQHAPAVFRDAGETSAVYHQPTDNAQRDAAHQALIACPTGSIGSDDPIVTRTAAAAFPTAISISDETLPDVRWCGYTSADSFGAWSWLIERPGGNVLVDSPRANPALELGLRARGGVARIILSHRDDIADHAHWHERFAAPRLAHAAENLGFPEDLVDGDDPVRLADDLLIIPTPGHTAGSICLLYRNEILFTGDHLWWNADHHGLSASRTYCWYDWPTQIASLRRLLDFPVRWVLPGHGSPWRAESPADFHRELERAIARLA